MSEINETPSPEQQVSLKAIMYADGGCRPSKGIGGYGYHGYTYLPVPQKTGSGCKFAQLTDQGYIKTKEGGGLKITPVTYLDGFGPLIPESTNQAAELVAANKALLSVSKYQPSEVRLLLDSQYVLQGLSGWVDTWQKNNWMKADGNPISNKEHWMALSATRKLLEDSGTKLHLQWVKGHNNGEALGNDLADIMATRGVYVGRNILSGQIDTDCNRDYEKDTPARGYWSARVDRNRLISHPKWYFTSDDQGHLSRCGRHVYYFGDAGDEDDLVGRKSSTATYSVLYLKQEDKYLAMMREAAKKLGVGHFQGPMRGHLDKIFSQSVLEELDQYGHITLQRDTQKQRLISPKDELLVEEIRPAKLAYRGMDRLNFLQLMLDQYIHRSTLVDVGEMRWTNITSKLYETTVSKKKTTVRLNPSITNTVRSLKFDVGYKTSRIESEKTISIQLTVGIDTPDRNTLAALASEHVDVVVLTWTESDQAIRYAVVLDTGYDDGIWSGIYSNLHLLAS